MHSSSHMTFDKAVITVGYLLFMKTKRLSMSNEPKNAHKIVWSREYDSAI